MRATNSLTFIASVLVLAWWPSAVHADVSTNALRATVVLLDGSRVVGSVKEDTLQVRSEILGEVKLRLAGISSLEGLGGTNLTTIKTVNADAFRVTLVTKVLHLTTSFGELKLATDLIRRVEISPSPSQAGTDLVAFWSGDGKGTDAINGCNASLIGDLSFQPGKQGQAFCLDGSSYLRIHGNPKLDVGQNDGLTFACWIKPATTEVQMPLLEYEQILGSRNGSDVGILLYINLPPSGGSGQGCIAVNLVDASQISHMLASPPHLIRPGVWQQVALTYDKTSGAAVIYLNGEAVATENLGSFTPETNLAYLLIGARTAYGSAHNPSDAFTGCLDEFGIYSRALSAKEIQSIFNSENSN